MAIARRTFLQMLVGTAVSNAIPSEMLPSAGKVAPPIAETTPLSPDFIESVADRFIDGILGDQNPTGVEGILSIPANNFPVHALGKSWRLDKKNEFATYNITGKDGYIDFKAMCDLPAAVAKLPDAVRLESETDDGARDRLVAFIDSHFTERLNQLHYLLKLDDATLSSVQQSDIFKDYVSEFNGGDTNIALTHEDIKRCIATKLEQMQLMFREVDRLMPEQGEYKGLTTLNVLLRQRLENYGNETYVSPIVAKIDSMDETTRIGMKMELEYASYFNLRLGAYSGMPDGFNALLNDHFQLYQNIFEHGKYDSKYADVYEEKYLRDSPGEMDETLRRVVARIRTTKSFTTKALGENAVQLSSQLLSRAVMPRAIKTLQQMFGDTAHITEEQGAIIIAFNPQDMRHQIARDLLESPMPNPLNEIFATPQQMAWEERVRSPETGQDKPFFGRTKA